MWNHLTIMQTLKNKIPLWLKIFLIRCIFFYQKNIYKLNYKRIPIENVEKRRIFLLLSTDYSNLGDHGMTYAHKKMLMETCPDANIVEFLVSDTMKVLDNMEKVIKPNDVITLKGGGNIGVEYFREELYRREIVKRFKNNKVIIFPQTAYFPDSKFGDKEFNNTKRIYLNNKSLYLFLRDEESYDMFREGKNVYLVPDIVQSLDDIENAELQRKGLLLCMRADVEGKYSQDDKNDLFNLGKKYFDTVTISDTTTKYNISINDRKKELYKIWNQMMSSELIVTDRLHGMIFAAITKTPCIVFNTYNYKLSGQYRWLKHLEFIKIIDFKIGDIESEFKKAISEGYNINSRDRYEEKFEIIKDLLRGNYND